MSETTLNEGTVPPEGDHGFFGHPKGLMILFLTEMWERFSYYGMRGLLIIYLTQHFLFSDETSALIYGAYTALVYVMTIVGGSLADRYLGQRKAVTFGAILLVLGHFGMAFEGQGSREYLVSGDRELVIEDEGRGGGRQLFVDVDGEQRRLIFKSEVFARLDGFGADGESVELRPLDDDGNGDYRIERTARNVVQQVCALLSLDCAGEEPTITLVLSDGREFSMQEIEQPNEDGEKESIQQVMVDGEALRFEEITQTDAVILVSADREEDPKAETLEVIEGGTFDTRVEKQQLFVYILYLSLALIIAGVGYLKANISTIVGALYGFKDPRRDSGFTIFYMGINLGSFLSSISCGILGIVYGWAYGFGLAGIGMLLGLVVFLWGQKYLGGAAEPPDAEKLKKRVFGPINVEFASYGVGLLMIVVSMLLVMNEEIVGGILGPLGIIMLVGLVGYTIIKLRGVEQSRMFAAIYFVLAQIPFWALFEQAGSSLNLFTDRLVDRTMLGWSVPAPVFQALNAGFIFIFAPIIAWMWIALAKRNREPSTPVKFSIGVFGVGLGFIALVAGMTATGATGMTPVYFIFLIYWVHTMAELMLSPVGLSAVTKMAPARIVGLTMGAWFLYSGLSNYLAGVIARGTGAETIGGQLTNVAAAKATYASVYSQVGYIAMAIGVVMLLISPLIKKLMCLDAPKDDEEIGHSGPRAEAAPAPGH